MPIPMPMPQGLEEMKETAREINEAVALGKETEAGINEVTSRESSDAGISTSHIHSRSQVSLLSAN